MIFNCLYNILILIINDKFSPNYLAVAMIIEGITEQLNSIIFNSTQFVDNLFRSIYIIIIYFILIIGVFIHNEILVINYWKLNENTKNIITKKSIEDFRIANETNKTNNSIDMEEEDNNNSIIELSLMTS